MIQFLNKIFQKLGLFNCFSHRTSGSSRREPEISVPDHPQSIPAIRDHVPHTQRQEPGRITPDRSSISIAVPVRGGRARSIDKRTTPPHVEREEEAKKPAQPVERKENEQTLEFVRERNGYQDENDLSQPEMLVSGMEDAAGQQEEEQQQEREREREREREQSQEARIGLSSILPKNRHQDNFISETVAPAEDSMPSVRTETIHMGSEEVSKSAAAPPTVSVSSTSSLDLSSLSTPRLEEPIFSQAHVHSDGYASSLPQLDVSESAFLNLQHTIAPQYGSLQRALLGPDASPQRLRAGLSPKLTRTESSERSIKIQARVSTESLGAHIYGHQRTPTDTSVGSDWDGTILDMECDSLDNGGPIVFQAKLDTAARRDAIAENIVKRLGMTWKPDRNSISFKVIGECAPDIIPLGYVTIHPRVIGRRGRLRLKCYVLKDADVGKAFDCLLGCSTSMKHFLALREDVSYRGSSTDDPSEE